MNEFTKKEFSELFDRYPALRVCENSIAEAFDLLNTAAKNGGTVFTCGNGGSCADSEHIVGELIKSFKRTRRISPALEEGLKQFGAAGQELADTLEGGIRAVALTSHPALTTAYANDRCPSAVFAQQLSVLASPGDCLIAVSTSGNSENCVLAAMAAKALGIKVICLTGENESRLSGISDAAIRVPAQKTYQIQEYHLPVYHALCAMLETEIFAGSEER